MIDAVMMHWNKDTNRKHTRGRAGASPALNLAEIKRDMLVIGASAGGVTALKRLFALLPAALPAIVGVVLHRSVLPGKLLLVLGRRSSLPIIEPGDGDALRHGTIYLAPADHHMLFYKGSVAVLRGPKEHSSRPAVDTLFRSAAASYRERVVGAVLTGCGEDGASGMIAIEAAGGIGVAQDPQEAEMPHMPLNAIRYGEVRAFTIDDLAWALGALARGESVGSPGNRESRNA
jgi:two-component system chemotaxis response regulator CheB